MFKDSLECKPTHDGGGITPFMSTSLSFLTMHESPYLGWIVPHPWQEPEYEDDETIDQLPEDESDYDDEGEFTLH